MGVNKGDDLMCRRSGSLLDLGGQCEAGRLAEKRQDGKGEGDDLLFIMIDGQQARWQGG